MRGVRVGGRSGGGGRGERGVGGVWEGAGGGTGGGGGDWEAAHASPLLGVQQIEKRAWRHSSK